MHIWRIRGESNTQVLAERPGSGRVSLAHAQRIQTFGGEGEISTRKRLSATSRFERGGLGNVQLLHGGVDMGRTCMAYR